MLSISFLRHCGRKSAPLASPRCIEPLRTTRTMLAATRSMRQAVPGKCVSVADVATLDRPRPFLRLLFRMGSATECCIATACAKVEACDRGSATAIFSKRIVLLTNVGQALRGILLPVDQPQSLRYLSKAAAACIRELSRFGRTRIPSGAVGGLATTALLPSYRRSCSSSTASGKDSTKPTSKAWSFSYVAL